MVTKNIWWIVRIALLITVDLMMRLGCIATLPALQRTHQRQTTLMIFRKYEKLKFWNSTVCKFLANIL